MNILLVASDNNISSGAFNSLTFLAKELKQQGYNVYVTVPEKGSGDKLLKDNDINYMYIKSYNWIGGTQKGLKEKIKNLVKAGRLIYNVIPYFKYKRLIKKYNIDIVHNNTLYTYIAASAAKSQKTKVVWHIREFLEEDQNSKFLFKKYSNKLINASSKIICISKKIYEKYSKVLKKEKLEIVYNGIDIEKYYIEKKEILNNEKISLLCVGGITEKKGQYELSEAVAKLKSKYNYDVELNLVGNYFEHSKQKIQDIQKKYNVNCINLLGRQSNTPQFYSNADIAFMCSTSEAFGRVTVEGMLAGCLLIGKNSAATVEIIEHEKNGLLYSDVDDLVEKMKYAIENKRKMNEIAKRGQIFAKDNFSASQNAINVAKVYEKTV